MIVCFGDCNALYFVLEWISDGYTDPAGKSAGAVAGLFQIEAIKEKAV